MERKTETIDIGKGVQYAKVSARLAEFHKQNAQCQIDTSCEFTEGWVYFRATVYTSKGTFTGHSLGKAAGAQKQFEKQETIAVGRALAFAGYLASGDIATFEEMQEFEGTTVTQAQLSALKLRFADAHPEIPRHHLRQKFSSWCYSGSNEDVDYHDHRNWEQEWYEACWQQLTGVSSDVPFEE